MMNGFTFASEAMTSAIDSSDAAVTAIRFSRWQKKKNEENANNALETESSDAERWCPLVGAMNSSCDFFGAALWAVFTIRSDS